MLVRGYIDQHPGVGSAAQILAGGTPEDRVEDDGLVVDVVVPACHASAARLGAIANSLIFNADGAPLLVMTSGAHRV